MQVVFTRDFRYWTAREIAEVPDEVGAEWCAADICQPVTPLMAAVHAAAITERGAPVESRGGKR